VEDSLGQKQIGHHHNH